VGEVTRKRAPTSGGGSLIIVVCDVICVIIVCVIIVCVIIVCVVIDVGRARPVDCAGRHSRCLPDLCDAAVEGGD
jgi:hypothetical protein